MTVRAVLPKLYRFRYTGGPFPEPAADVAEDARLFDDVLDEVRGLFRERNNVYHSRFRDGGIGGILSWIAAKTQRMSSLIVQGAASERDEDLTENLLDVAVYAILGAMLSYYDHAEAPRCTHLFAAEKTDSRARCLLCGERARIVPDAD